MSQTLKTYTPFRSNRVRTQAVVFLLAAGMVFDLLGALSTGVQIGTGSVNDPTSEEFTLFDLIDLGIVLLQFVLSVATIVLFCMWMYRAYQNLTALGNPRQSLKHSPGWAVGSFFIPFVNLVVPYRAAKEIWAKSDPEVTTDDLIASYEPSPPSNFPLWWGFWLVSGVVNNAAARMYFRADTQGEMTAAAWLDFFGDLLSIPAAVFAILVVRSIDGRQEQRRGRVSYAENVPPPPPLFSPTQSAPTNPANEPGARQ